MTIRLVKLLKQDDEDEHDDDEDDHDDDKHCVMTYIV